MRSLFARLWLLLWRWKVVGDPNLPPKCVVIAAPHTSNWDFPLTLAMAWINGIDIKWLGKEQMFNKVLGPFFRAVGGISIKRESPDGIVGDLASMFSQHDRLVMVVPAEGTRSKVDYWKSGFYRIASQAQVPIVCAFVDKSTRSRGFGPTITPSGDISADMDLIREFYAGKVGLKPEGTSTPRLREEDKDAPDAGKTGNGTAGNGTDGNGDAASGATGEDGPS